MLGASSDALTSSLTTVETTLLRLARRVATTLGDVSADRQSERANSEPGHGRDQSPTEYSERLWVPLWWWGAGAAIAVLLSAEVHMGAPGVRAWLPYVVLVPLVGWALFAFSRMRIDVVNRDGVAELCVGKAHLPLNVVSKVAVVPRTAKSAALGRQLDPLAFVQHRTWVKEMVIVVLDDPDDPTPYWLVSSKRPEELVDVLVRHGAERR